jgi:hypothetical protein
MESLRKQERSFSKLLCNGCFDRLAWIVYDPFNKGKRQTWQHVDKSCVETKMKVESWPWNTTSYSTFTHEELLTRCLSLDSPETGQNKLHDRKTCWRVRKAVCAAHRKAVQPSLTEIVMKIWRYDLILRVLDCTVLWLFHLVCILYCGCCNLSCYVRVSVCWGVSTIVWVFW